MSDNTHFAIDIFLNITSRLKAEANKLIVKLVQHFHGVEMTVCAGQTLHKRERRVDPMRLLHGPSMFAHVSTSKSFLHLQRISQTATADLTP